MSDLLESGMQRMWGRDLINSHLGQQLNEDLVALKGAIAMQHAGNDHVAIECVYRHVRIGRTHRVDADCANVKRWVGSLRQREECDM